MELLNDLCKFDRIVIEANISLSLFFRYNVYCSVFKFEKKPTYLLPPSCSAFRVSFRANRLSRDEGSASCPSRRKGSRKGRRWEIKGKDREEIITKPSGRDTGINIWQRNLGRRELISPVQLRCWSSCISIERFLPEQTEVNALFSLYMPFNLEGSVRRLLSHSCLNIGLISDSIRRIWSSLVLIIDLSNVKSFEDSSSWKVRVLQKFPWRDIRRRERSAQHETGRGPGYGDLSGFLVFLEEERGKVARL